MKRTSQEILDKLKKGHVHPKPKWHFVSKSILLWLFFMLVVIVGSLAFSAMLFRIYNEDWGIYQHLGRNPVQHFFMTIPYLWIILVVVLALLAVYSFKHTKGGYRHKPLIVVSVSILGGVVIGTILFAGGCGNYIDRQFSEHPSFIRFAHEKQQQIWSQPEKGLLAGTVLEIFPGDVFKLEDFEGKQWQVIYIGDSERYVEFLVEGADLRLVGEQVGEADFEAVKIHPWRAGAGKLFHLREQVKSGFKPALQPVK